MSKLHSPVHFISVERLKDVGVDLSILAYPSSESSEVSKRVSTMLKLGVSALAVKLLGDHPSLLVLGKGVRGVVVLGLIEDVKVAVKLMRTDASVKGMEREASMHSKANGLGVGPKLFSWADEMIVMEYVGGSRLGDLITAWQRKQLKPVIESALNQAFILDANQLDHGQLSNASDHVIADQTGRTFIIDFSHSSTTRRPANVTSFTSYLLNSLFRERPVHNLLQPLLRQYKQNLQPSLFLDLKKTILSLAEG
ncbi:MAG: hypothetical protein NZ570_07850 [Candidatus Caldarchaeum sp.]|nr:hypothetical protein [Candidatus Caldarchaeum sp.]MCS7138384.1 hypothetical protein [Candidatus Caldarchaeum sp.]MDW7978901.1 hypothetical protein [Candidatus Caldarchaeum sp.]MDW8359853.1 hypothetical protein [Candidatus Caldarchaeum sp.]